MPFELPADDPSGAPPPPQVQAKGFSLPGEADLTNPPPATFAGDLKRSAKDRLGEAANLERHIGSVYKDRVSDALKNISAYNEELKKDMNANPEGWGPQILQSSKVALDAINSVLATGGAAIEMTGAPATAQATIVEPIRKGLESIRDKVSAHLDARKKGDSNWALHKEDIKDLTENLDKAQEFLVQSTVGAFVGGPAGEEGAAVRAGRASLRAADEAKGARPVDVPRPPDIPPPGTPKPRVQVVGKTPEGKPRVRLITDGPKAQVSDAMHQLDPGTHAHFQTGAFRDHFELNKDWSAVHNVSVPLYHDVYTTGESIGAHTVLDRMLSYEIYNSAGYTKEFLTKLRAHIDDVPIKFVDHVSGFEDLPQEHQEAINGAYYGSDHRIEIKYPKDISANNPLTTQIVAHELVHAATVRFIHLNPFHQLSMDLERLFTEAEYRVKKLNYKSASDYHLSDTWPGYQFYGMTNTKEFVAEAMTNPRFQRFLAKSEEFASASWPKQLRNLYNRLSSIVQKILGIKDPQEASLLHRTMDVTQRIMEQQAEEALMERELGDPDASMTYAHMSRKELPGEKNLASWLDYLNRNINPEGLGRGAKQAAAIVAHRMAVKRRLEAIWQNGSKARRQYWDVNPEKIGKFLTGLEKGETFHDDPQLQAMKQHYKLWARNIFEQDTLYTKLKYSPTDNYIPHLFKDEDRDAVIDFLNAKYKTKWGDPGFIKERSFATIEDARAAGFELKFKTPEEMMLARQHASDIAGMHTDILRDLQDQGLATEVQKGRKQPIKTSVRRSPNGDLYYVDNHAFQILQNAFDIKGLWGDRTPLGQAYRGAMSLKNALVVAKLAASGFHALHVLGIDSAAVLSREFEGLITGNSNPIAALSRMLKSGIVGSLFEHPRLGGALVRAFDNPEIAKRMGAQTTQAIEYMLEGGFTPHLDFIYKSAGEKTVLEALKTLSIKQPLALPYALMAAMRKPLFDIWIPNLKAASYVKDVTMAMKMDPSLLDNAMKRKLRFRQIANSIDNRYGEMLYNNLFWNKYLKDIGTLNMLSMGWQLGFIREFGGAAVDTGRFGRAVVQGKAAPALARGALHKPLFAAAYFGQSLMIGGMMTWSMTGETPKDWKDYVFPRIGGKNADGTPRRVTTMFYTREIPMLAKHMETQGVIGGLGGLISSKGSGMFGLLADMATNMNSFGQEISNPDAPLVKRIGQKLHYALSTEVEPISIRSLLQQGDVKGGVLAVAGFGPAPKYITDTATESAIKDVFGRFVAPKQTPYDRAQFSQEAKAYKEAERKHDPQANAILTKMQTQYGLNYKETANLQKQARSGTDPLVTMFKMIGEKDWRLQKKLLDGMPPEERKKYLKYANKAHLAYGKYKAPEE